MIVKLHKLVEAVLENVDHVIYMHADHFEPYAKDLAICDERLKIWTNDLKKLKIKPSLFVFPSLLMKYIDGKITSEPSSTTLMIVSYLKAMEENGADINLHIHHERWTTSSVTVEPWITLLREKKVTDDQMLESHIIDVKELLEKAKIDMSSWGFVHGMWGLNASDRKVCNIENELLILRRFGCFGDFTFPAGRPHCNPQMSGIFSAPLKAGVKVYNVGLELKKGQNYLQKHDKFLIFYPTKSYFYVSIDGLLLNQGKSAYYYGSTINPYMYRKDGHTIATSCPEDSLEIIQEWLLSSMIIDKTLIIKTHAHSMVNVFWDFGGEVKNQSPLFQANHIERMDMLESAMAERNIGLHYLTARELYDFCIKIDKGESAESFLGGQK